MKVIGVVVNTDKDQGLKYTRILIDSISKSGGECILPPEIAEELSMESFATTEADIMEKSDCIICLGGDGTFLKAARKAYTFQKPILGINLGSLGFLTEIDKNDIPAAVENIRNGKFTIEHRMMLDTAIIRENSIIARDIALNDIVISKGSLSRILHLKAFVNETLIDLIPGDGLIVSSPTGSTAYSLSAGGPIVEPDTDLMIVTPICPHILYSRSFVTTGDRIVSVVIEESGSYDAMVTVDGQNGYKVFGGDCIEVRKSPHFVKMIRLSSHDFFNVLRAKIYDRGEKLRKDEV
ncbi:MAG: NAD(+)/NADH kinase [Clostridia bacterium]|nr:NAD(+)/NADH kinase [Clostridia bacterium]